jgi:perosamine synthetase
MVVRLNDSYSQEHRDRTMALLAEKGIATSNYFTPIHLQPFYRETWGYAPGAMPETERLSARTLALPFHNKLSEADVERVVRTLKSVL